MRHFVDILKRFEKSRLEKRIKKKGKKEKTLNASNS